MALTLEQLEKAFKEQDNKITMKSLNITDSSEDCTENGYYNIKKAELGYEISQNNRVILSHYENEGRNHRLESVYMDLVRKLPFWILRNILALHDHKGNLMILLGLEYDIWYMAEDILDVAGQAWLNHYEDDWAVEIYNNNSIYAYHSFDDKKGIGRSDRGDQFFYQCIRYKIAQDLPGLAGVYHG